MPPRLTFVVGALLALGAIPTGAADLQAFRQPWNDASPGITNLQSWQPRAAGDDGWVAATADGHYAVGGERIRFLGVNITASSCFPDRERADGHAARLARFGFNAVRFHHMEANWEPNSVLIDYAGGTSRNLSSDRLDRLHYFVSALAARGIYSNINLLVSRQFFAGDGLGAEIEQMNWKDQHILGFFNDAALALHREYATRLLTAPNPHRGGRSLAQDPCVAIVEIMNENGLLQKWFEGVLDRMPAVYRAQLQARWNTWLRARYGNTAAMLAGWSAVDQPLGPNRLLNGDFASGTGNWNGEQHNTAKASFTGTTDFDGARSLRITVTTAGTAGWEVQVNQGGLPLVRGELYTVSFWAKADRATPLSAGVQQAHADWATISPGVSVTLGTAWQKYSWTFQAGVDEPNARVNFNGFGDRLASVWLADVRFQNGGRAGALEAGQNLEAGTVPNLAASATTMNPTVGQRRDWCEFILRLEQAYWTTMTSHLKQTLGYRGVVFGTIISNSPPNAQAASDAFDSHAYWQHPAWPVGKDWDPVDWTLNNVSMVDDADTGTLAGLMRQRVQGRPHNVTEYQHPSPNTYASEGPLLAAVYGSLQDWDGLWMFDYSTSKNEYVTGFFDHGGHPGKMANNLLAAAIFRRGDVGRARKEYAMAFTPATEVEAAATRGTAWSIADGAHLGVPATRGLVSRLSLAIGDGSGGLGAVPTAPGGTVLASDTGELAWDRSVAGKAVVTVNAPRTKAVIGHPAGRSFSLGGVTITPGATRQDWCTLGITLLEGTGFGDAAAGRALVVATGDQENTGMVWKSSAKNSVGDRWGTAPVLIEVVPATVVLPVAPSRVTAWALDSRGQRTSALAVGDDAGRARLTLGVNGATVWYEVEIAGGTPEAPSVAKQPLGRTVSAGQAVELRAEFSGWPVPAIQWFRNGSAIPGATRSVWRVNVVDASTAGLYHAQAVNTAGAVTTRQALVALAGPTATPMYGVATRGPVLGGGDILIAGFAVLGDSGRDVLLRGSGPSLAPRGVSGVLGDPVLKVFPLGSSEPIAVNGTWDPGVIGNLFGELGLAPLTDPREACLKLRLAPGVYTAQLTGGGGTTGIGLLELYDLGGQSGRLPALSTRGVAGRGNDSLIVGFVLTGATPRRLLIRGVGPALGPLGVGNAVADPTITVVEIAGTGGRVIAANDDWDDYGAGPATEAAARGSGAMSLPPRSADAGLVIDLEPGVYTAVMESKGGTGVGLVEVYEVN